MKPSDMVYCPNRHNRRAMAAIVAQMARKQAADKRRREMQQGSRRAAR